MRDTRDAQTADNIESGAIHQLDGLIDECDDCHYVKRGRWIDDPDEGSGEWFTCYDCLALQEDEA